MAAFRFVVNGWREQRVQGWYFQDGERNYQRIR